MTEKYLTLFHLTGKPSNFLAMIPIHKTWITPKYGILKINTHDAFVNGKVGNILIRNSLSILNLAKAIPQQGRFSMDYGEFLGIIEGYISRLPLSEKPIIESDSLLLVKSLSNSSIVFQS